MKSFIRLQLSEVDLKALNAVKDSKGHSTKYLGETLGVTQKHAQVTLRYLRKAGLIKIDAEKTETPKYPVFTLTELGEKTLEALKEIKAHLEKNAKAA